jgi:hypothetical protein
MENLTKQTLRDAKARQALGLELNTFEENKDVPITGTSYALTYRGHDWIIDGEFALNSVTGESLDVATFKLALQRDRAKDKSFSIDYVVLGTEEIQDLLPEIKDSDYISNTVVREHEGRDGFYHVTCKVIIWKDEDGEPNLLVSEIEKKTSDGADLLAFLEPQTRLYNGLCNSMLYWSDEVEKTLEFLGFENLQAGLWFQASSKIIARVGEYNFFKRGTKMRPVASKSTKARESLLAL